MIGRWPVFASSSVAASAAGLGPGNRTADAVEGRDTDSLSPAYTGGLSSAGYGLNPWSVPGHADQGWTGQSAQSVSGLPSPAGLGAGSPPLGMLECCGTGTGGVNGMPGGMPGGMMTGADSGSTPGAATGGWNPNSSQNSSLINMNMAAAAVQAERQRQFVLSNPPLAALHSMTESKVPPPHSTASMLSQPSPVYHGGTSPSASQASPLGGLGGMKPFSLLSTPHNIADILTRSAAHQLGLTSSMPLNTNPMNSMYFNPSGRFPSNCKPLVDLPSRNPIYWPGLMPNQTWRSSKYSKQYPLITVMFLLLYTCYLSSVWLCLLLWKQVGTH